MLHFSDCQVREHAFKRFIFLWGMVCITMLGGKVRQMSAVLWCVCPNTILTGSHGISFLAISGNYRMSWRFCRGKQQWQTWERLDACRFLPGVTPGPSRGSVACFVYYLQYLEWTTLTLWGKWSRAECHGEHEVFSHKKRENPAEVTRVWISGVQVNL